MMSLFGGASSAVGPAATSDAQSMIPLTVVRQMVQEIADTRASNLAFRQAVADHERDSIGTSKDVTGTSSVSTAPVVKQAKSGSRGRGAAGTRGPGGTTPMNRSDLRVRPPSNKNVPSSVPRSIGRQMYWESYKFDGNLNAQNGQPAENNFQFTLANHPHQANLRALFDQYAVVSATVSFFSELPPGSLELPPILVTCLDFDNAANFGNKQALQDFGTSQETVMSPGRAYTRSVMPCVKLDAPNYAGAYVGRQWCDCGYPNIPWYGIRSWLEASGGIVQVKFVATVYFAFRNQT